MKNSYKIEAELEIIKDGKYFLTKKRVALLNKETWNCFFFVILLFE